MVLLEDLDGRAMNYASFEEAGEPAEELVQQMIDAGRAERVDTWDQVKEKVGDGAKLTKLACIVKEKDNGER